MSNSSSNLNPFSTIEFTGQKTVGWPTEGLLFMKPTGPGIAPLKYPAGLDEPMKSHHNVKGGTVFSASNKLPDQLPYPHQEIFIDNQNVMPMEDAILFEKVAPVPSPRPEHLPTNTELEMDLLVHNDGLKKRQVSQDHSAHRKKLLAEYHHELKVAAQIADSNPRLSTSTQHRANEQLLAADPELFHAIISTNTEKSDRGYSFEATQRRQARSEQNARVIAERSRRERQAELSSIASQSQGAVRDEIQRRQERMEQMNIEGDIEVGVVPQGHLEVVATEDIEGMLDNELDSILQAVEPVEDEKQSYFMIVDIDNGQGTLEEKVELIYNRFTAPKLKEIARSRNLTTRGNKRELIRRILAQVTIDRQEVLRELNLLNQRPNRTPEQEFKIERIQRSPLMMRM